MRRRAQVDENQQSIIDGLRACGRSVTPLHTVGGGVPDLLVGYQSGNFLLEVKRDKKAKLTPAQIDWHLLWRGQRAIVTTLEEAIIITDGRRAKFQTTTN